MRAPESRVLGRHGVGFCHLTEEGFHLSSRHERDQNTPLSCADMRPDVWHFAWPQDRIARSERCACLADFDYKFAFQYVEPFVLLVM